MNTFFGYKIEHSFDLPYRIAIDKNEMELYEQSDERIASSRVYFICRVKKIKFDTRSIRLRWGRLSFRLIVGSKVTKRISLRLCNYYKVVLLRTDIMEDCISLLVDGDSVWHLPVIELQSFADLQEMRQPEVLYVGETFDKSNRYKAHEKLLKATTLINNEIEELRVYFHAMRFIYAGGHGSNSPLELLKELKDINSKTSVKLLERLFIQLFKPTLNKKNVESDIYTDTLVRTKLIENGIQYVHLDIGMVGDSYRYFSANCERKGDFYYFDLINRSFAEGFPELD